MKPVGFEALARLPIVRYYERAFSKATGVPLRVLPPGPPGQRVSFGESENPFCALVGATPAGCAACLDTGTGLLSRASRKQSSQQLYCFAGLTEVAVPVVVAGEHVATLMSGQVFRREPTERDFGLVLKMLGESCNSEDERKLRKAYFQTPVVTADRFQAILHLLDVFSQYLADFAGRLAIAGADGEPKAVLAAKEYVQSHVQEPITLAQVVEEVHVSRFYFCKIFKKATGMTLTEYVARVRVEKAKSLLVDPSLRISEVVFAAGFGSIPRFNSLFKRFVGMAPTQYRATLKAQLPV